MLSKIAKIVGGALVVTVFGVIVGATIEAIRQVREEEKEAKVDLEKLGEEEKPAEKLPEILKTRRAAVFNKYEGEIIEKLEKVDAEVVEPEVEAIKDVTTLQELADVLTDAAKPDKEVVEDAIEAALEEDPTISIQEVSDVATKARKRHPKTEESES